MTKQTSKESTDTSSNASTTTGHESEGVDFIRQRIQGDVQSGRISAVVTRFPPEPNGYLHIGHAKSICLNFGVAQEFGGQTFLRFDDTNPEKESTDYVDSIAADVRWLGFDWGTNLTYASDYFSQLFDMAVGLIEQGKAYVCELSAEEMRDYRGTLTEPGRNSPYRDRSVADNLDLFQRMRAGEFADGAYVLRAKIDMASPNINMRDPVLYRIRHVAHHRTGSDWVIYPTYDYTHCVCDALEGITHSLCTLEFADHRPLYDWVLEQIQMNVHPPQIEFSRLNLEYTVMSKRILNELVHDGVVDGWDDPRLPTIAGLRRRGVPAAAIRDFCARVGVTRQANVIEMSLFNFCVRQQLENSVPRAMAVFRPLKVTLSNFAEVPDPLIAKWHPKQDMSERHLPFGPVLYIEREDFARHPPKKFKRLVPGGIVRLRYAYIIECEEVIEDANGEVVELICRYVPDSRSGSDNSGLKPKGVIHWVDAQAPSYEVCEYESLFTHPQPSAASWREQMNDESLVKTTARVEAGFDVDEWSRVQFERRGYYTWDASKQVFNSIVGLRDTYQPNQSQ